MSKRMTEEFSQVKEAIEQQCQQLKVLCAKQMEPLSPFSVTTSEAVYQKIARDRKDAQEKE